jgi:ribonuclease P protein component
MTMTMTGRIVRAADFERVLAAAAKARSQHFAVHYAPGSPSQPAKPEPWRSKMELSTEDAPALDTAVDDFREALAEIGGPEIRFWLGLVVPKRHARRSVTRSLFKRQIRAAAVRHAPALAGGLWVVRLRAPFEKAKFPSAASAALKRAAREELDRLFAGAAQPVSAR